jgi:hypothetical protein
MHLGYGRARTLIKETISMGKHDREKDQDGQVPSDKPLPKGDWIQKDDGGRHSPGKQDTDQRDDDEK